MNEYEFAKLEELARKQAALCKVFGSTRRVLIIWVLNGEEKAVTEIARSVGSSMQSASQHLRLMKDKGVLTSRKDGQAVLYRIAENKLMQNCTILKQSPLSEKQGHNEKPFLAQNTYLDKEKFDD